MAKKQAGKKGNSDGITGIILIVIAVLLLFTFGQKDTAGGIKENVLGWAGEVLSRLLYFVFGKLALFIPFIIGFYGVNTLRGSREYNTTKPVMSIVILFLAVSILFTLMTGSNRTEEYILKQPVKQQKELMKKEVFTVNSASASAIKMKEIKDLLTAIKASQNEAYFYKAGVTGHYASNILLGTIDLLGTYITAIIMVMVSIILFGKEELLIGIWKFIAEITAKGARGLGHAAVVLFTALGEFFTRKRKEEKKKPAKEEDKKEKKEKEEEPEEELDDAPTKKEKPKKEKINVIAAKEKPKTPVTIQSIVKGDFKLPPSDFLHAAPEKVESVDYTEDAELLKRTLEEFGIEGQIVSVIDGPVISRFEIDLATGVKVSQVENLAPDIALAMKAEQVRVASVSDKGLLGIEVPKRFRKTIVLKDLIEDETFQKSESLLTIAIGRDLGGNPIVANLAEMPHFLIAGSTGSGKSVCINTIIMSILYKASPDEVKLVLVDPKQVELTHYRDLPHLIAPVITDPKHAAYVLKKLVFEMKARYDILAAEGAQNIVSYNKIVEDYNTENKKDKDLKPEEMKKSMPYIVLVIDELADLMTMAKSTVEESLQRLAQLARAVGIHLVLATQRPSVDVITGVIKANFPSRVAFKVKSQIDSRTILDTKGAESLIGKGDMLYAPQDKIKPVRGQGALVTPQEISKVVHFINKQRKPEISEEFQFKDDIDILSGGGFNDDPMDTGLMDRAKLLAKEKGNISTSYLQRKLGIGYSKAARLIDDMEEKGIISGPDGNKPREYIGD